MSGDAFVQHIGAALGVRATEATRTLEVVYRVLGEAASAGETADFEARLPADIGAHLARLR
jgi:uncharacterized protein (DUF2267 family)